MSKVKKSTHSSERSSSSCSSSSLSSDEEVDAQDLKPIKDYLTNRRELARQLFKSVKPEKIRMMLPQTLKKVDLNELEEWCASELNGMSKTRILCIINGKTMVESSDTSQSDDSGPSLEIISDTEEWFTDDDASKKGDGTPSDKAKLRKDKIKPKGKSQIHKKDDTDKLKVKSKPVAKDWPDNKKIKKEDDKETNKEKEGDSLLDLLELEMRARAIRALIRKEEDILPASSASKSTENSGTLHKNDVSKTASDEKKAKEKCRRQLEKIISAQRGSTAEDEDVVLVIQPTPTIELLSSDSESEAHSGTRVNQRLENERVLETEKSHIENGNVKSVHDTNLDNIKKNRRTQQISEIDEDVDTYKQEGSKRIHSNSTENKSAQSLTSVKTDSGVEKKRKLKRKAYTKDDLNTRDLQEDSTELHETNTNQPVENTSPVSSAHVNENMENTKEDESKPVDIIESVTKKENVTEEQNNAKVHDTVKSVLMDDEKSTDMEEIIDLDDYCDDMEDMENLDNDNSKNKQTNENEKHKPLVETPASQKSTETWASRYYQTDDVQNVIKESKIQSEIRKRLRERQRLSKLNKSPNSNSAPSCSATDAANNKPDPDPMGSVHEYLALKRSTSASLSSCSDNNTTNEVQDTDVSNDTGTPVNTENLGNVPLDIDTQIYVNDTANIEAPSFSKDSEIVNTNSDGNPD